MTSQISSKKNFASVLRAELKQTAWLMALFFVVTLFTLPIYSLLVSPDLISDSYFLDDPSSVKLLPELFIRNYPLMLASFLFAIAASWNRFGYLHSSSRVDFLHSLPISRRSVFWNKVAVGNIAYLLPYVLNWTIAATIFFLRTGQFDLRVALFTIVFNWVFFNLFYALCTLAALTTGTRVTMAIMGFLVFEMIQIACFSTLTMMNHLQTFTYDNWNLLSYTSAISMYFDYSIRPNIWLVALLAMLLLVLCCYLYRIRPSEVCGRAIWGKYYAQAVKYLTLYSAAITCSMIFQEIGRSNSWLYLGAAFAIFFGHLIAEGIFHFSIKNIFANWKGMLVLMLVVFALITTVTMDLLGFDRRYTPVSEVEYYEINLFALGTYERNTYRISSENGKELMDSVIQSGLSNLSKQHNNDFAYKSLGVETTTSVKVSIKPKGRMVYVRSYQVSDTVYHNFIQAFLKEREYQEQLINFIDKKLQDSDSLVISTGDYGQRYRTESVQDSETIKKIVAALKNDIMNASFSEQSKYQTLASLEIIPKQQENLYHATGEYRPIKIYEEYENTVKVLKELKLPVGEVLRVEDIVRVEFNESEYEGLRNEYLAEGMSEEEIVRRFKPNSWKVTDSDEIKELLSGYVFEEDENYQIKIDYSMPAFVYMRDGKSFLMYKVIEE